MYLVEREVLSVIKITSHFCFRNRGYDTSLEGKPRFTEVTL